METFALIKTVQRGRQGDFKKKTESEEILKECPSVRFEPRMSAGRFTCVATESLDE